MHIDEDQMCKIQGKKPTDHNTINLEKLTPRKPPTQEKTHKSPSKTLVISKNANWERGLTLASKEKATT